MTVNTICKHQKYYTMKYIPNRNNPAIILCFYLIFLSINLSPFIVFAQQKSVGGVYDPANKAFWIKAEDIVGLQDGERISNWPDATVFNHEALQTIDSLKPTFIMNSPVFNNKPVVEFNKNLLRVKDHESLDGMQELTVISVLRNTAPDDNVGHFQGIIAKSRKTSTTWHRHSWSFFFADKRRRLAFRENEIQRTATYDYFDEAMVHSAVVGFEKKLLIFSNSYIKNDWGFHNSGLARQPQAPLIIGNMSETNKEWFRGEIAEIVVLRQSLNPAQRLIVEMILANKYGITLKQSGLTIPNFVESLNLEYSNDIIGIGGINTPDFGYQKHTNNYGGGGGLYLSEVSQSFDQPNEFVFAGHDSPGSVQWVDSELPLGTEDQDILQRWNRVWNVTRSIPQGQGNGTSVRIGFDFDETELEIDNQSGYVLLYRENSTGEFSRVTTNGASGNKVIFTLSDSQFRAGYYTIAKSSIQIKTWTSLTSGPWNSPNTWGEETYPGYNGSDGEADNVIILENHNITVTSSENGLVFGDLYIAQGGKLILGESRDHNFNTIRGNGKIEIVGNYFPISDASLFIGLDGGTVIYKGDSDYAFDEPREFYNLEIDLGSTSTQINLLKNLIVNGNLTINKGEVVINNDESIEDIYGLINGDLIIKSAGKLLTGEGNARHNINIKGNLINNGIARFSNLTEASYWDEPINGKVDVVFDNPSGDQTVQINGLTEFYRIEIKKNSTDSLILRATGNNQFYLFGPNSIKMDGFAPNISNKNALGLLSGILVIEDNIHIPKIFSNTNVASGYSVGDYIIDLDAQIVLKGGKLEAEGDINSLTIMGKLIILNGELKLPTQEGLHLRNSGVFDIRDGVAEISMFRTSGAWGNHRGAYVQSGGKVTVNGINDTDGWWGNNNYYRFTLPYESNTFIMTGGELIVSLPNRCNTCIANNGGILIASKSENTTVTGGIVTLVINDKRSFIINSAAPFYNLRLINDTKEGGYSFYIDSYPGGGTGAGLDSPPPAVDAHPLRVINLLEILNTSGFDPSIMNLNGHELILEGDLYLENDSNLMGYEPNSLLSINGNGNSNLNLYNNNSLNISRVVINKLNLTDTVSLNRANESTDIYPLIIDDLFSLQNGMLDYNDFEIHLKGNLFLNGFLGTDMDFGKVIMNGSAEQSISVALGENFTQIGHLEINNVNGVNLLSNSIDLIGNITLENGIFYIGQNGVKIKNTIYGAGFSPSKMIATAGGHSNEGVSIFIDEDKSLFFPVGSIGEKNKYTPLNASYNEIDGPFFIQVNPVDQRLSTLHGDSQDESLDYYWRIRYRNLNDVELPTVESYTFTFDSEDIPSETDGFVPGKIINFNRYFESSPSNFNSASSTILFDAGFPLEEGEYTAGIESMFIGSVQVYYSYLANSSDSEPLVWNDLNNWRLVGNTIPENLPSSGDIVVIGYNEDDIPHRIEITSNVNIAGVKFPSLDNNGNPLPELIIDESRSTNIKLGNVSGEGMIKFYLSEVPNEDFSLEADYTDFDTFDRSMFLFAGNNENEYSVRLNKTAYPNIGFSGPETGIATITLPEIDLLIFGSLEIRNNTIVRISSGDQGGDLKIYQDLIVGDVGSHSAILQYPSTQAQRKIDVLGDIIVNGPDSYFGVNHSEENIIHQLSLKGSLIQNNGSIVFYHSITSPRVTLELTGLINSNYVRTEGNKPFFYRIIMNKGNNHERIFSFDSDFILNDHAELIDYKPVTLLNGTLQLAGEGTNVHLLKNGGVNFIIPQTAGLILKNNVVAQANGGYDSGSDNGAIYDHEGITLHGLLRLSENSKLLMAETAGLKWSKAHIQYGSTGNSRLEISDAARLEVAAQIRGILDNPSSNLKYRQTGGVVMVGKNRDFPYYKLLPLPAVFEIANQGSSFVFTGGAIEIVRGFKFYEHSLKETLYLHPSESIIGDEAIFRLGIKNAPFEPQLRSMSVSSSISPP
jgi:hypothetical protein